MEEKSKMTFTIVTLTHAPQIGISGPYEDVAKVYLQILFAFGAKCDVNESGEIKCQGERYQTYSQKIKDNLVSLIGLSSDNVIGQLYNIFKQMEFGDPFAFFPQSLTDDEISIVRDEMLKRFLGTNYDNFKSYYNDVWKEIHNNYDMTSYDNGHNTVHSIGERKKEKRICRFCGRMMPETTFKNKSHSISEALGNKNIITNDECDVCNGKFGKGIELDLINLLDFFRAYYGIQGKGGKKSFVSSDFEISKNDTAVSLKVLDENVVLEDKNNIRIQLKHPQKINLQNVYRALIKYALSVLDSSCLHNFQETIKWVKSECSCNELPWVTILVTNQKSDSFPIINVFVRKSDTKELPYSFMTLEIDGLEIIALLPLSSKDDCAFDNDVDFKRFWNFLKPYNQIPILQRFKPVADEAKEFTYNLSFHQKGD